MDTPDCRLTERPHADRPMKAIFIRLIGVFFFGIMFACIKLAGERGVTLVESMFYRNAVGVPLILVYLASNAGVKTLKTEHIGKHISRSALGLIGMFFTFGSFRMLPLAEATTIGFTTPIFATILAAFVLHEFVGVYRWSAVIVGFVGVLLVTRPGSGSIPLLGASVALISALIISIISIQLRDMGRTEAATTTVFYFSAFSTLMLAFVMPFFAQQHDALTWGILLLLGVSGSIAQIAMSASLRLGAVSAVVSMDYTQLFWATAFGFVLFGQLPAPTTWTGAPFIIASGLYIAYREHRRGVLKAQAVG